MTEKESVDIWCRLSCPEGTPVVPSRGLHAWTLLWASSRHYQLPIYAMKKFKGRMRRATYGGVGMKAESRIARSEINTDDVPLGAGTYIPRQCPPTVQIRTAFCSLEGRGT